MSIFQPYVGLTTTARKEWEKIHGKLSRNNVPNIMQDMLDISLIHLPQISGSLNQETITILLEMTHYLLSHKVYYVETALARSLMKTNINLQLSDLKLPYRISQIHGFFGRGILWFLAMNVINVKMGKPVLFGGGLMRSCTKRSH